MTGSGVERVGERLGPATRDVLEALLASVADAVYLVDPEGRVEFASPAALEMLGSPEEEPLGASSHETIHRHHWDGTPFPQSECPMRRPRTSGETVRLDDDCFRRRGGCRWPAATARSSSFATSPPSARPRRSRSARRPSGRATPSCAPRARGSSRRPTPSERARVSCDLHDGAQRRLVRVLLAVRLAAQDAAGVGELLAEAAGEIEEAITELRDLVNGIHPALLTHRGLAAAVDSLTARLPLLVTCEVSEQRWGRRPASEASVRVGERDGALHIEVGDDGRGGAALQGGRLADRVDAAGGTLSVHSPPGGPTRIQAEVPLPGPG
ncbi:MAG TPA: histidine kinase [Solirubrobacteraceae bacterium]|jgi:PAS domain S-box-containing protein|nr:histidine kinase [Solirubrobacteraceae bacterium]